MSNKEEQLVFDAIERMREERLSRYTDARVKIAEKSAGYAERVAIYKEEGGRGNNFDSGPSMNDEEHVANLKDSYFEAAKASQWFVREYMQQRTETT